MIDKRQVFLTGLHELGLTAAPEQLALFDQFMSLMLEWNEKINLTAIIDPEEIITKHFLDSLIPLIFKDKYGINLNSILDLGTGAGFPGIPLKIMLPEAEIVLADSLNKRIKYLENVICDLGFKKIEAIHGRAEEMGQNPNFREQYMTVFSRAVASMNVLAEYCLPFVKVGGYFVALKGPEIEGELNNSKKAIKTLGGEIIAVEKLELPLIKDPRSIVFVKKVSLTPRKYPRKAGTPVKSPL